MLATGGFRVSKQRLAQLFGSKLGAFLNNLKYTYTPKVGPPVTIRLYEVSATDYILPRTMISRLEKIIETKYALPDLVPKNYEPTMELFNNQQLVVDHLYNYLMGQPELRRTCVLNMQAGLGKTYIAAGLIAKFKLRTLYIVPKRPLMMQAVDDLRTCFTPIEEQIGARNVIVAAAAAASNDLIYVPTAEILEKVKAIEAKFHVINPFDPKKDNSADSITVIVINSALKQPPTFFAGYSFVIMDEVHMYCSEKRRTIFKHATAPIMLGMSATTADRKDGFDICTKYELCFDDVIYAANLPGWESNEVKFKTEVTIIKYSGPPEYSQTLTHPSTGMIFTPYMHKQAAADPFRVKLAVAEIKELFDQGYNVYVFAEEREMLTSLEAALGLTSIGMFVGGMKDADVKTAATRQILLTTYGFASTGVSIDKQTAIVFYTPRRANMKQILARILRRSGDPTITRRIKDIVDVGTPMKHQLTSRKVAYEYYEMEVKTKNIHWTTLK